MAITVISRVNSPVNIQILESEKETERSSTQRRKRKSLQK